MEGGAHAEAEGAGTAQDGRTRTRWMRWSPKRLQTSSNSRATSSKVASEACGVCAEGWMGLRGEGQSLDGHTSGYPLHHDLACPGRSGCMCMYPYAYYPYAYHTHTHTHTHKPYLTRVMVWEGGHRFREGRGRHGGEPRR